MVNNILKYYSLSDLQYTVWFLLFTSVICKMSVYNGPKNYWKIINYYYYYQILLASTNNFCFYIYILYYLFEKHLCHSSLKYMAFIHKTFFFLECNEIHTWCCHGQLINISHVFYTIKIKPASFILTTNKESMQSIWISSFRYHFTPDGGSVLLISKQTRLK